MNQYRRIFGDWGVPACVFVLSSCGPNAASESSGSATGGGAPDIDAAHSSGSSDVGAGASGNVGPDGSGGSLGLGSAEAGVSAEAGTLGVACPKPGGAPVTLTPAGGGYVLENGLVTVTIDATGHVRQVAKASTNLMRSGDSLYVSENGGPAYYANTASSHRVVQQTPDIVELSFVDTTGGKHDMDWDLHYVMRRGVSGFYYFLVTAVGTPTHPNPVTLGELRTVQRFDPTILSNGYNGERHGQLPTPAQNATFSVTTQIEDATYPLTVPPQKLAGTSSDGFLGPRYDEGPVFSKYDWASYRVEDLVHGLYGNGFGAWALSPSWEYYTGGPVKQELMVHHDNLILNMYHGGHFGSAVGTASSPGWEKLYGPNLVYINQGTDAQLIADARAQGTTERAQWPYCWMKSALYPLAAARGTVSGRLVEAHGQSVAGARVVLGQPGEILLQAYDYMFWSDADASGHFSIPNVRPGTYSVHVYATQGTIVDDPDNGEIVGTLKVARGANDAGTLKWSPPYHANLLWAVGTSDRRSGEFRFDPSTAAGADNTAARTGRMYGPSPTAAVWTVPPANTTYIVGASHPDTAWYFVQSADGTWSVRFDLAAVPPGGVYLTIGLAGAARNPHLDVLVNGHAVASVGLGNDQSLYRSALQGGRFQMVAATVPARDLVAGANEVSLQLVTKGTAGAGVYYDIVKLESD